MHNDKPEKPVEPPLLRRLLAMLNWRPVYEIEQKKSLQEANPRLDAVFALIRFQLADTPISRLQLNAALAELLEEVKPSEPNG